MNKSLKLRKRKNELDEELAELLVSSKLDGDKEKEAEEYNKRIYERNNVIGGLRSLDRESSL